LQCQARGIPSAMKVFQLIRHWFYVIATGLLVTSCASVPPSGSHKFDLTPSNGLASVVIVRPSLMAYGLRDLTVSLNGQVIADIPNASFIIAQVKPGSIQVAGEGGTLSWPRRNIVFDVVPDEVRFVVWRADEVLDMSKIGKAKMLDEIRWDLTSGRDGLEIIRDLQYVHSENQNVQRMPTAPIM